MKERLNLHNIDCVHSQNSTLKSKVFRDFFFFYLDFKAHILSILGWKSQIESLEVCIIAESN